LQGQLHELLGGRAHILEALTEGHHSEAHALQVLHHLHSSPAVKGNLTDVEPFSQPLDEFFDITVVDDVALRSLEISLPFPDVIRNVVAPDAQVKGLFRYPEVWEHHVFIFLIHRREHQYKGRDIRCGGQVETTVAD